MDKEDKLWQPTSDLTQKLRELIDRVEQGAISDEELVKITLPIYMELNQRNQKNYEILRGQLQDHESRINQLTDTIEDLACENGMYQEFINQQGIGDLFDQFISEQVDKAAYKMRQHLRVVQ